MDKPLDEPPVRRRAYGIRHYVFAVFLFTHILCLLYNNLIIEEQTYYDFFLNRKETGLAYDLMQSTGPLGAAFTAYSQYTGAETGYGFYAPNVSSQMVVVFTVYDTTSRIVNVTMPQFSSFESQLRYFTAFDTFLDKLDSVNPAYDKFIDIILKSMAYRTLRNHPPHRNIDADIYVYDLPHMPQYRRGGRPEYAHILHYQYAVKNVTDLQLK